VGGPKDLKMPCYRQSGAARDLGWAKPALRLASVVALAAALWTVAELLARSNLHRALAEGWPVPSGRLEESLTLFPTPSARQLEANAQDLEIDLRPRSGRPPPLGPPRTTSGWKAIDGPAKEYLHARLSAPTRASVPAPTPVAGFLHQHEEGIRRVEKTLLSNGPPQWPMDSRKGFNAPLPNLLGNLFLVRLLVAAALQHGSAGEGDAGWRDLEAASRLPDGLFRRPEVISQLVALAEASMITGAMRQMPGPPPQWALTWPEHDLVGEMNQAATADAWMLYVPFNSPPTTDLFNADSGQENNATTGGRVLSFLLSPYMRASAANAASAHSRLLREYANRSACSQILTTWKPNELLPEWNRFGRIALPSEAIGSAYGKVHLLLAQLEGTRLVLAARRGRSDEGAWPAVAPEVRSPCAQRIWSYARTDSGELVVAATTPLLINGVQGAWNLSQRYVERGPQQPVGSGPEQSRQSGG
jgi:hypothetical protein